VKSTGDEILATFDGPARAIQCACSIRDAVSGLGLQIRAGLHTGEVEMMKDDIGGIAVHICSCSGAGPPGRGPRLWSVTPAGGRFRHWIR
jgi:hypothetical protein